MEAQAQLVARYLYANPILVPDRDASVVTVVTGPDFGAVLKSPRPASQVPLPTTTTTSTTTTTAPVTTSTNPSSNGTSTSAAAGPTTTTTTVAGYVPGPAPAGQSCG
jgi:hypothetical protein